MSVSEPVTTLISVSDVRFRTSHNIDVRFRISDKINVRFRTTAKLNVRFSVWGPNGCRIITAMIFLPHYVSELTITLFTFERYVAVCRPMKSFSFSTVRRTLACIGATWVIACIFMTPCLYFIDGRYFYLKYTSDVEDGGQ